MKRTFAFMMALVLVLSLSIGAFAAGTGSITVNNAVNDVEYKLYKIFDATYKADPNPDKDGDGTKDIVSYSLKTTSPVYTYMFNGKTVTGGKIVGDFFTYEVGTGVITMNPGVNNSDVFAYLTTMVRTLYNDTVANDGCFVAKQTAADQKVVFTGLEYGYYLIDTEKQSDDDATRADIAVTITTNTPNANVIEKNEVPGDLEKDTTSESVKVGDTIEWTITFRATNYTEDEKIKAYTVIDTLSSDWATYNINSFVVKVGDDVLTKDTGYTVTQNSDTKVTINIPWATVDADGKVVSFLYDAVETVTITYSATVTEKAATALELKNNAEMDWVEEDGGIGDGGEDDTETDTFNLGFTKIDGVTEEALAGAEFALYSNAECTQPVYVKETADGVYIFDKDATAETGSNTVVTPEGGKVVIQGLAKGTYYLKETKAPDGYNKLAEPIVVNLGATTMEGENEVPVQSTFGTYIVAHEELNIANNSGVELPSTGGEGTMMMITIGTMVAMAFGVLMITQKKMSIYQD